MKTSFTNASTIELNIDLGLGEMESLIKMLEEKVDAGTNDWRSEHLLKAFKTTKAESLRQLINSLEHSA